jgi:hypothetical protein
VGGGIWKGMQNGGLFRGPAGDGFLHQTSKFWSRGPYGGPRWRCSYFTFVSLSIYLFIYLFIFYFFSISIFIFFLNFASINIFIVRDEMQICSHYNNKLFRL